MDLQRVQQAVRECVGEGYYVGGCVRDCLLGRPLKDLDLLVAGSPWKIAQALARSLRGSPFWLRKEDQVARVVLGKPATLFLDLLPLLVPLAEDLQARDLTINALAVHVRDGLSADATVIDPTGGLADLRSRRLRFARSDALPRDPLRAMRAVRFRWQLGFDLAPEAEAAVREYAPLLVRVSRERVRDELFAVLAQEHAADAVADLFRLDLWSPVFGVEPGPAWGGEPAPVAAVRRLDRRVRQARERLSAAERRQLAGLLGQVVTDPRSRASLARLAAALMGAWVPDPGSAGVPPACPERAGRPRSQGSDPGAVCSDLRLSAKERALVVRALESAPAVHEAVARWPVPGRERLHLFRAAGEGRVEAVLLAAALADRWTGPLVELLREGLSRQLSPQRPLLSGREVMALTGLSPGRELGRLLDALEDARADGEIQDPERAREWILHCEPGEEPGRV